MIQVQVSPYIKKFSDAKFGNPIFLNTKIRDHIIIKCLLLQPDYPTLFPEVNEVKPPSRSPFSINIEVKSVYTKHRTNFNKRLIMVAHYFNTVFLEEMHTWVKTHTTIINNRPGEHNIKNLLEKFCNQYNIQLEEDITPDALVKMYYRYRSRLHKIPTQPENKMTA